MDETYGVIVFYLFAALAVGGGLLVLFVKEIVRAAFSLLAALAGVAGLYVLLGADFLGFAQVLVYIGGIMILLLFGVMLTSREPILVRRIPERGLFIPGLITGGGLFFGLYYVITRVVWTPRPGAEEFVAKATSEGIGDMIMTDYVLPFEVASVLLLAALVGAAMIARRRVR